MRARAPVGALLIACLLVLSALAVPGAAQNNETGNETSNETGNQTAPPTNSTGNTTDEASGNRTTPPIDEVPWAGIVVGAIAFGASLFVARAF